MELIRKLTITLILALTSVLAQAGHGGNGDFVPSDSLGTDSVSWVGDSLVVLARSYLGTPYKFGARGPEAFDCSGFTLFVYRNFDIVLPSSSRTQINAGSEIPRDSVREGDLIFLTSPNSRQRPGHVGIVTRNDEEGLFFVHSSSLRGVVEDRLNAYYLKRLIAFRRIL